MSKTKKTYKEGDVIRPKLPKNWRPWKLNKRNAIRFANEVLAKTKLCGGHLFDRTCQLSCAVGEAQIRFLPKTRHSYYVFEGGSWRECNLDTRRIACLLVEAAGLGNTARGEILRCALEDVVTANDESKGGKARNRAVTKAWLERVVPLLK